MMDNSNLWISNNFISSRTGTVPTSTCSRYSIVFHAFWAASNSASTIWSRVASTIIAMSLEDDGDSSSLRQVTVLIENPRKSTNWGPLLRCCTAFGITQIFCIGYEQCSVQGSHGASKHVQITAFHTSEAAQSGLKELGFQIVGLLQGAPGANYYQESPVQCVEQEIREGCIEQVVHVVSSEKTSEDDIVEGETLALVPTTPPTSVPLHHQPFSERTCIAVGKRSRGLPLSLARICDSLVHIPHHGLDEHKLTNETKNLTMSSWLTVEAGLSIVLHEFAMWAGYGKPSSKTGKVFQYQGQKYHVAKTVRGSGGGIEDQNQKKEERRVKREKQLLEMEVDDSHMAVFGTISNEDGDN